MDPLPSAGLKVASSKGGEGGVKDGRVNGRARSSGGDFFLSLLRVEGSQEDAPRALVLHASLERRSVCVRICPPPAAVVLLWAPSFISRFPPKRLNRL